MTEDENEKLIRLMMLQQAQLLAEMERAYAEEEAEVTITGRSYYYIIKYSNGED